MKRKYIIQGTLTLLILASFTACGGGSDDASFKNSENLVDIDVNCTAGTQTQTTIDTYIPVYSGDVIVKEDDNTSVSIYHDINGTKKICLEYGNAHIIRK